MHGSWIYRLGDLTRGHHAAADAQRLAIMDVRSTTQYRRFLERIWGFESGVEASASAAPGVEQALRGARTRAGRLYDDLLALGDTPLDIASLPVVTIELRTSSEALGWLLVIERHVLLAGLVRRSLAYSLRDFTTASRYFATHPDGGRRFRDLGDTVTGCIAGGHAQPEAILTAARAAYEAQGQWYSRIQRLHARRPEAGDPTEPRSAA